MVDQEYWQQLVNELTKQRNQALNNLADALARLNITEKELHNFKTNGQD